VTSLRDVLTIMVSLYCSKEKTNISNESDARKIFVIFVMSENQKHSYIV